MVDTTITSLLGRKLAILVRTVGVGAFHWLRTPVAQAGVQVHPVYRGAVLTNMIRALGVKAVLLEGSLHLFRHGNGIELHCSSLDVLDELVVLGPHETADTGDLPCEAGEF